VKLCKGGFSRAMWDEEDVVCEERLVCWGGPTPAYCSGTAAGAANTHCTRWKAVETGSQTSVFGVDSYNCS
jgi:hypothetical protein